MVERNLVPAKAGAAHGDADTPYSILRRPGLCDDRSAQRLDACFASAFVGQQQADRAAGIAAGFDFAAVRIEDAHAHIGAVCGFEYDQLIAADPGLAVGERGGAARCHRQSARARVDHDEIVAEAMHLAKRNVHGAG
jgi:hypothetical protein